MWKRYSRHFQPGEGPCRGLLPKFSVIVKSLRTFVWSSRLELNSQATGRCLAQVVWKLASNLQIQLSWWLVVTGAAQQVDDLHWASTGSSQPEVLLNICTLRNMPPVESWRKNVEAGTRFLVYLYLGSALLLCWGRGTQGDGRSSEAVHGGSRCSEAVLSDGECSRNLLGLRLAYRIDHRSLRRKGFFDLFFHLAEGGRYLKISNNAGRVS